MVQPKISKIHIPAGCEILIGENEAELISLGVIPDSVETKIEISYSVLKVQGSKAEEVITLIRDPKVKGSSELYEIDMEKIAKATGGVLKVTKTPGAQVTGETFTINTLEKSKFYVLPGQNATGSKQTITTVKQGAKTLAEGTDYVQLQGESGLWGLMILSGSTATNGNTIITYSYTPAAYIKATMGSGCESIKSNVVRFLKVMNGKKFQVTMHKAEMTNGISLSFPSVNSDGLPTLPVEFEGGLDTSKKDGEQLVEIIDEFGV